MLVTQGIAVIQSTLTTDINIAMQYVTTAEQIADIFTKALDPLTFIKFRDRLVVSRAALSIAEKVPKVKEPVAEAVKEQPEKKRRIV